MADPKRVSTGPKEQDQPESHDSPPASVSREESKGSNLKTIVSRLDHPVTLAYGDEAIVVPPRGLIPNVNPSMLGAPPSGITLIANTGRK